MMKWKNYVVHKSNPSGYFCCCVSFCVCHSVLAHNPFFVGVLVWATYSSKWICKTLYSIPHTAHKWFPFEKCQEKKSSVCVWAGLTQQANTKNYPAWICIVMLRDCAKRVCTTVKGFWVLIKTIHTKKILAHDSRVRTSRRPPLKKQIMIIVMMLEKNKIHQFTPRSREDCVFHPGHGDRVRQRTCSRAH